MLPIDLSIFAYCYTTSLTGEQLLLHGFCSWFTAFLSVYQHVHPAGSTLDTVPMIGTSLKLSLSFKIKIVVDAP